MSDSTLEYSLSIVSLYISSFNKAFFQSIGIPEVWKNLNSDLATFINSLNSNQQSALEKGLMNLLTKNKLTVRTSIFRDLTTAVGIINFLTLHFTINTISLSIQEQRMCNTHKIFIKFLSYTGPDLKGKILAWAKTLINDENIQQVSQTLFSSANIGGILPLKPRLLKIADKTSIMHGKAVTNANRKIQK